ncbi:MAG: hypothetical protein P4L28_05465 [Paludibacteraceae bacterium]|nr:hypothetical protein [Paludibacteraceae bacterium]
MKLKGMPKTGGRVKGTQNKTTTELKEIINSFVSNNLENLQSDFDRLMPAKRFEVLDKMLRYVLPNKVEQTGENGKELFSDLSDEEIQKQYEEARRILDE